MDATHPRPNPTHSRRAPPHEKLDAGPVPTAKTAKHEAAPPAADAAIGVRPDEALTTREKQGRSGFWFGAARKMSRGGANHAQQHGVLIGKAVCLSCMRTRIEDLPLVRVSTLVANGYIRRDAGTALVQFGDDGVEYGVGVRTRPFRNGGFWAMLVCPRCGGGAQRLRLLNNRPACGKCVRASGLRYRVESTSAKDRHLLTAPERLARLNGDSPARVNPRPGRRLDRRAPIEAALKRSLLVARRRGIAEFEKKLIDP